MENRILLEQVRYAYAQSRAGLVGNLINGSILVLLLRDAVDTSRLVGWSCLMLLVLAARLRMHIAYQRRAPDHPYPWVTGLRISALATGMVWGVGAVWLFPVHSLPEQMFLVFMIAGTAAGAVPFFSAVQGVYPIYATAMLVPFAVVLAAQGDEVRVVMGLVTVVYGAVLLISSHRIHQSMTHAYRLRFENEALLRASHQSRHDLEQSNNALREQRAWLAEAQRLAHIGNWLWQAGEGLVYCSDEAYRIMDMAEDGPPPDLAALLPRITAEDRWKLLRALAGARRRGERLEQMLQIQAGDAPLRAVRLQARFERDKAGTLRRALGTIQDVTEQTRASRLKDEFISTVSHELRTPLTSIRGSLGLLSNAVIAELPPQAQNLIGIAQSNSERLLLLVNDLLDMEKIEAGKMRFELRPVAIGEVLLDSMAAHRDYAAQRQVDLRLTGTLPELWVRADPDRLQQVFANLISNATKFSHPGGTVEVALTRQESDQARVAVTDYGIGISDAFRARIFDKFTQADASDTRNRGGTGLGLTISRALVERMEGHIDLASRLGEGSTFYVSFPLVTPDP